MPRYKYCTVLYAARLKRRRVDERPFGEMTTMTTDPPKAPGAVEEAEGIYAKASPPSLITRYFSDGGSLNKVPSIVGYGI